MLSCGDRMFKAWIYFSFLTFSKLSNFFFMHLMATYLPVFSDRAVKTTEKVPLPFSYSSLYWSMPFINKKYNCNSRHEIIVGNDDFFSFSLFEVI